VEQEFLEILMEKIEDKYMKAEDLVRVIDKLVEKKLNTKVKQLIREEVSSQVNKVMGKMLVEMIKESKQPVSKQSIPVSQTEIPTFTKDPRLNSVLTETARYSQPIRRPAGQLAELMDGGFDKIGGGEEVYTSESGPSAPRPRIQQDGTNLAFLRSMVSSEDAASVGQQQSVLGTDAVPDVLKAVFNKNFRKEMKKIDEVKKNGPSGLINPSMVLSG
jgi:hypothetical protein